MKVILYLRIFSIVFNAKITNTSPSRSKRTQVMSSSSTCTRFIHWY